MTACLLLAVALLEMQKNGIALKAECESAAIDPGRSVFLRLELKASPGTRVDLPDLRDRVKGFSLAEDFEEPPRTEKDGSTVHVANWKLIPEPCADEYKVKPFVVTVGPDASKSFVAGPLRFENPPPREPVTGDMEVSPKKDIPPLSWKLVGWIAAALVGLAAAVIALVALVRYLVRRIKEHRMSPIERAWAELDRLLKKGLPGRGRYKDFYVELTMVVRRYVQRKYGIKAPHMTTEEFLRECGAAEGRVGDTQALRRFLESADMVKFAGVEATPDMADEATGSARDYLQRDSRDAGH